MRSLNRPCPGRPVGGDSRAGRRLSQGGEPTMRDRFATTPDGRIHYLHEGSGPPLVLLHSVGCSAYEYEDSLPLLAQHFTVYAWDMPGHGDSDPLPRHYTIEDFARAVVHLMDAV